MQNWNTIGPSFTAWIAAIALAMLAVTDARPGTPGELLEAFRNMTFPSQWTRSGQAPLIDGLYEEPEVPGSASKVVVRLTELIAAGAIDDRATAAVVIMTDPGGSGVFFDLHLLQQQENRWNVVDHVLLGDRIHVNDIEIVQGLIRLDLTFPGPRDPLCCPTKPETVHYALNHGRLVKIEASWRIPSHDERS